MAELSTEKRSRGDDSAYGIAALSLLEALILVLVDKDLLDTDELDEAYAAAIHAHRHHNATHSTEQNRLAADILSRLKVSGNSVRLDR